MTRLTKKEHERMGTGGTNWWEKIKHPTESTSPVVVTKTEKYKRGDVDEKNNTHQSARN